MKVYRMENVENIENYDQYIKDFEEQAAEYCKGSARSLLESLFAEYTTMCGQGVYLDGEQTKHGVPITFSFHVYSNGEPVSYLGMRD